MGIRDRPISPRSPWQNPYAERLIGTLRRDCLDHTLVFGARHLQRILTAYGRYYNAASYCLSLYVVDLKRLACGYFDPAGCARRLRTRSTRRVASSRSRIARLKSQGPSGRGWVTDIDATGGEIILVIHWAGGVHTELRTPRRHRGQRKSTALEVVEAVRMLACKCTDDVIAGVLTRNDLRTANGNRWTRERVTSLRNYHGIPIEPATILRWHRAGFRSYWRWKSRKRAGRPRIDRDLRDLIRRMSRENRLWGAPRIHGELLKLGFKLAESTVSKYIIRRGHPSFDFTLFGRDTQRSRTDAKQGCSLGEIHPSFGLAGIWSINTTWTVPSRIGHSRVIHTSSARSLPRSGRRAGRCLKAMLS